MVETSSQQPAVEQRGLRHPLAWVVTTNFAEGFPYSLVNNIAELLFQALGASLQAIGLTALFHLPWNLKFLWAPLLDRYETKRRFLIGCEVAILGLTLVLALLGAATTLGMLSFVFVMLAIVSATHDIAIDAFYLEALDKAGQAKYVGFRASAFRGATLLASGPLLIVVGKLGWGLGWLLAALIVAAFTAYHWAWLPQVELRKAPLREWFTRKRAGILLVGVVVLGSIPSLESRWPVLGPARKAIGDALAPIPVIGALNLADWIGVLLLAVVIVGVAMLGRVHRWLARHPSQYARGYVALLDRPLMGRALAFIVLFRLGESFLMKMRMPFLRGPGGMDLDSYALINGTLGWSATLGATILGGWLISRHGLRRWLWTFVLAQNLPNLFYAWAASQPDPAGLGHVVLGAIVVGEDIGAGLGTGVFMIYIMRCVDPSHKATHMAVLTAIMSIGFTLAGVASGFLADLLGFANYFVLTFAATVPSMLLLPFVPYLDDRTPERTEQDPPRRE